MRLYLSNSGSSPVNDGSSHAPVVVNVVDGETVHQRILLIYGRAGPRDVDFESKITVEHNANNFPSTTWQVFNSHFKCLVHLDPGLNEIRFILDTKPFSSGSQPLTAKFKVNYVPLLQNPPLNLVILIAKDSKETIDAPKEKKISGENKLEAVIAKLRCAGYLWQAFTAEQMNRNGFGRRVFRLDEEWMEDTLSNQNPRLRQTAKVHIIRSSYTLKQILDPDIAQQNPNRVDGKKDLFSIFMDSLKEYGAPFDKQCYVAGLILDTHYDNSPDMKFVRGHAALGGGWGHIQLGIFGSHLTHAWPRYLEEVVSCFQDETKIDEKKLSNDSGESGTWWRCCNIGIGAFLHEVGHCLTAPHSPSGIMARGFNYLNRTFTVKEPKHPIPTTPSEEKGAHWHRVNVIRFRYHPCFRLPSESPMRTELENVGSDLWLLGDVVLIKCPSGISLIEMYNGGTIVNYMDYSDDQIEIIEIQFKAIEFIKKYGGNVKINFIGKNRTETFIENLQNFLKSSKITLPVYGTVFKSIYLGNLEQGLTEFQVLFNKSNKSKLNKFATLKRMVIKYDHYIDSITFFWSDNTSLKAGANKKGTEKEFTLEEGERIVEMKVRSGWYIDGFEIKTNLGRISEWFGGHGGSKHTFKVPNNEFEMIGLYGTSDYRVNTLGFIYKKIF